MRRMIIFVISSLLIVPLFAQDTENYHLRHPTVEDYLRLASELPDSDIYGNPINKRPVIDEFQTLVSEKATAQQLLDFFYVFNQGFSSFGHYSPNLNVRQWHSDIVIRWLENHPTNLYITEKLWILGYRIEFSSYDFDNDRRTELLAYIEGGMAIEIIGYLNLIIVRKADLKFTYYRLHMGTLTTQYRTKNGAVQSYSI